MSDEQPKHKCPHCAYELLGEQKMFSTCPYCMQPIKLSDFKKQVNTEND